MKSKIFISTLLFAVTTPALAMMCPANFNPIDIGDTLDKIIQQCGKPDSQKEVKVVNDNEPQEWVYYEQVDPTGQADMRATFAFMNKKLVSMTANGMGISVTQICQGNLVSVGDSEESVKRACGTPPFVNKGNVPPSKEPPVKTIEITYDLPTKTTFVFENGILKERK